MSKTQFATGAVRDTQDGKPNFLECLSPFALWRYGKYMALASKRYGSDNWTKGIPRESYLASLERHLLKLKQEFKYNFFECEKCGNIDFISPVPEVCPACGEVATDHAAALVFNIQGFLHEGELAKLKDKAKSQSCAVVDTGEKIKQLTQ
jgi:hypothetical protein